MANGNTPQYPYYLITPFAYKACYGVIGPNYILKRTKGWMVDFKYYRDHSSNKLTVFTKDIIVKQVIYLKVYF